MAQNSLFAVLLRSPWWISFVIAGVLGLLGFALLPEQVRVAGALGGFPFIVIGIIAANRQRHLPSGKQVEATQQAVLAMSWPAFSALLERIFERDGGEIRPSKRPGADYEIERNGRVMLVSARRWKSARTGVESLRALQQAREAADAPDALYVGLGQLSESARPYATEHGIEVWQAAELARALRGIPLEVPRER
jgi:restriction system protein